MEMTNTEHTTIVPTDRLIDIASECLGVSPEAVKRQIAVISAYRDNVAEMAPERLAMDLIISFLAANDPFDGEWHGPLDPCIETDKRTKENFYVGSSNPSLTVDDNDLKLRRLRIIAGVACGALASLLLPFESTSEAALPPNT
jgi:hypothetical protein